MEYIFHIFGDNAHQLISENFLERMKGLYSSKFYYRENYMIGF